jgi:pentatricopeptide repeat protein
MLTHVARNRQTLYDSLIRAYTKAGQWQKAQAAFNQM